MSVARFSEDIGYVPDLNGCRKKIVEYCRDSEVAIDRLVEENAELRDSESKLVNETEDLKCQIEDLTDVLKVLSDADNHSVSQVRMAMRKARQLLNK